MLATAIVYFVAASFGENFEPGSHEAKAAESGQENLEGIPQHESAESNHAMTSTSAGKHASHNETAGVTATAVQGIGGANQFSNESTKRGTELPLFLAAGIAYALMGFWIIHNKNSSRIPYIVAAAGSLILIGLYSASHTIGVPLIGLEHIGVLDLLVAALQLGIIGCSAYIILSLSRHKIARSAEKSI
jgi:hypothetical protein